MKKLISIIMMVVLCATVFVACKKDDVTGSDIAAAGDYLYGLYKDDSSVTPSDYDVAGRVMVGDVKYTVEWSVDVTEGVTIKESATEGFFTVDVNEKTTVEIAYTLTATIKNEAGETVQKTFKRTVPAYKMFTYAEYAAAEDDATVVVSGIVTGIFSKSNGSSANGLYIQDLNNEGGYYVYGVADDKDPSADLGIKVGMTVAATGAKDTYNGTYEVVGAALEILDSTIKEVAPVDFTEAFKNAAALNDAALTGRQSLLVTIKGVEITGQDEANGYYKFKLGNNEAYVRLSSSNNCITVAEKDTFKKTHTDNFGYTADVTGIVSLYSGNFYLIPATVDAFENFTLPTRTDKEKVEMELSTIVVESVVSENKTIKLPLKGSTYAEVVYTWVSDNAAAVFNAATGDLVITVPDAPATVKLTLTAKCGNETKTQEFTVSLTKLATPADIVNAAHALAKGESLPGKYTLTGVITKVDTVYSEQYKNVTVIISVAGMNDKLIQCYRLKGDGADKIAVGDNITVTGTLKNYNGTIEFDSGCTLDAYKTAAQIVDDAYALEKDKSLAEKYTLTGVITKVDTAYSEQYKNVTVTIQVGDKADKLIQCFRLKGEGADKIKVGDTITVYGEIKNYNGTIEFNSGCVLVEVAAGTDAPATPALKTPEEILNAAYALETGKALDGTYTLTGVITKVDTAYSEQYKNVTVTIQVGTLTDKTIQCFRLKGDGADKIKVGDTITVTGSISNYNGAVQFGSGCSLDSYKAS